MKKEILVLSGSGHKGIVKITPSGEDLKRCRIECSLDFRPTSAALYLLGDNIAKMTLNDTNNVDEVLFCANNGVCCVLRSSAFTMFGGAGNKGEMLKRIEAFEKQETLDIGAEQKQEDGKKTQIYATQKEEQKGEPALDFGATILGDYVRYDGNDFYFAVKPQIDEMFVCYPKEPALERALPCSKWVRVDADGDYYVVGLLFDDGKPSYICYGVPHRLGDTSAPPADINELCSWLAVSGGEEGVDGYWVIYQSATTGNIKPRYLG